MIAFAVKATPSDQILRYSDSVNSGAPDIQEITVREMK